MKFNRSDVSILPLSCEMISTLLSNLLGASSLTESCFYCFTVNILKYICVRAAARKKSRLVPFNAVPTSRPTPITNAAIETPPVMTVDVMRPVSTMLVVASNCFTFFARSSQTSLWSSKNSLIWVILFEWYACSACGVVGFRSGKILLSLLLYIHGLFDRWR